jgi:hypothetical protein
VVRYAVEEAMRPALNQIGVVVALTATAKFVSGVKGKAPEELVRVIGEAPMVVKVVQVRPEEQVTVVVATDDTPAPPLLMRS